MQITAAPSRHGSVPRVSSTTQRRARKVHVVHAKSSAYVAPSSRTGATELEALERYTEVSPTIMIFRKPVCIVLCYRHDGLHISE